MRMGQVAGIVAVGILAVACGMDQHRPDFHDEENETPEFSAARLGDGEGSVADFLAPEEREAVRRSGMTGIRVDDPPAADEQGEEQEKAPPKGPIGHAFDTAGKVGVAVLGVGLSLAAAAAPFFLF